MKVIARMQSPDNSPVDITWANDTDALGVVQSVTQLLQAEKDDSPWAPTILSITIELP